MANDVGILAPEARIVLASTGDRYDRDLAMPAIEQGFDPRRLYIVAIRERACPVFWRQAAEHLAADLPPEVRDGLERVSAVWEFRQLRFVERLERSLAALADAGIDVLVIKGAALACQVYTSFADRPMIDIDLLIDEGRASEAHEVLRNAGWTWQGETFSQDTYLGHHHLPPLHDSTGTELMLEVHRDICIPGHPFEFPPEHLWEGAETVRLGGLEARVPDPVVHLVYLSIHFAWSHRLTQGAWRAFRDVRYLTRAEGFSWDRFVYGAQKCRAASCAYWTLRLASSFARVPVDEGALEHLRPPIGDRLADTIERHLALALFPVGTFCPSLRLERWLWRAAIQPGASGHPSSAALPWAREDEIPGTTAKARLLDRTAHRIRGLVRWGPYLRRLLRRGA